MPQLSLTDFVDIVSKAGTPKATKVRAVKARPEYEPAFDFYKSLREHIVQAHRMGLGKKSFAALLAKQTDPKKMSSYPEVVDAYKKWWGNKNIGWFDPPRDGYVVGDVEILLNPELGLEIKDKRFVTKLYFKKTALKASQAELITDLLEHRLRNAVPPETDFAVLDVRKSKLHSRGAHAVATIPAINAEIAYIASLWSA